MPRQVSDEEYNWLKGQEQIAKFVGSIYDDPQLNYEAKALIKRKYPNINIPDFDLKNQIEQRFAEERQAREDEARQRREAEEQRDFQEKRSATQKKYGFTDDGMRDLEQFMVDNNVGSYEVAAKYRAAENPKASEASFDDMRWNHAKQEGFKEIAADPEAWGRGEIMKALNADRERERNQKF